MPESLEPPLKAPAPVLSPCSSCRPCLRLLQPETAQAILSAPLNPQPGTQFFSSNHNLSSILLKNSPESKNKPEGIAQSPPVKNATRQTYRLGGLVSRLCDSVFRQGLLMYSFFLIILKQLFAGKSGTLSRMIFLCLGIPRHKRGCTSPFGSQFRKT